MPLYNTNPPIAPDEARALVRLLQRHNYKVTLDESDRQAPGDLFAEGPGQSAGLFEDAPPRIAPASQVLADTGVSLGDEHKGGISLDDLGDEKPKRPRKHLKGAAKRAWIKNHYGSKRAMIRHMNKIRKQRGK